MKEIEDVSNCLSHFARLWRLNRDSADGQVLLGGCYSVLSCGGAEDSVKCLWGSCDGALCCCCCCHSLSGNYQCNNCSDWYFALWCDCSEQSVAAAAASSVSFCASAVETVERVVSMFLSAMVPCPVWDSAQCRGICSYCGSSSFHSKPLLRQSLSATYWEFGNIRI